MATRGPLGRGKRERERARAERHKMKAERREAAKQRKSNAPAGEPGVDPDIAGIVPGPQANPWLDDLDEPESDTDESSDEGQE